VVAGATSDSDQARRTAVKRRGVLGWRGAAVERRSGAGETTRAEGTAKVTHDGVWLRSDGLRGGGLRQGCEECGRKQKSEEECWTRSANESVRWAAIEKKGMCF